ncbi:hypothetical protein V6N11_063659 [Hibiscus sabdariffa]|uniref:Uncharacterized protein n=1 Tax=Hibiscus sabdariffa TaxID=183260 RepID=A0ABR2PLR4_9ROSI
MEFKATSDASSRSRVIPVLAHNSVQQQDGSSRGDVSTTEDINQATTNVNSEPIISHVEPQSFTEETLDEVAGSEHTPQLSERSLEHNANDGSLGSMSASQSVHVANQDMEGSEGVVNQVKSLGHNNATQVSEPLDM